jgi:hypothetical protein
MEAQPSLNPSYPPLSLAIDLPSQAVWYLLAGSALPLLSTPSRMLARWPAASGLIIVARRGRRCRLSSSAFLPSSPACAFAFAFAGYFLPALRKSHDCQQLEPSGPCRILQSAHWPCRLISLSIKNKGTRKQRDNWLTSVGAQCRFEHRILAISSGETQPPSLTPFHFLLEFFQAPALSYLRIDLLCTRLRFNRFPSFLTNVTHAAKVSFFRAGIAIPKVSLYLSPVLTKCVGRP